MRPVMVAAAAVALIGAVSLTPAGSVAQSFGTIFQPKQIAVIPIRPGELRTLPPLYKFGTLHTSAPTRMQPVHTAAAAAAASGMAVLQPSSLPAGVPHSPSYEVMPGSTSSFTFSAAKARQTAIAEHRSLPPMPARIDGSTLQLKTGVAVIAVYGKQNDIPPLVVGQMKAPRLSSTGVTVRELEDYVLSLPGVSPQIRAEVKAIGDPTATLPIPLPVNTANAQRVQVQGVTGLAIGDSTGLGSGVVWEKNGIIYGVGGTLTQNQAIDIANSLR